MKDVETGIASSVPWRLALLIVALTVLVSCAPDDPTGDWTTQARARSWEAIGIADRILYAPTPEDGEWWFSDETLVLSEHGGYLEVDLGHDVEVETLVLQVDGNDLYVVEGSIDGSTWETIWSFAPVQTDSGLRARGLTLEEPTRVRWIRVRGEGGDGVYVLGALRLPVEPPAGAPRLALAAEAPPDGFPWLSLEAIDVIKLAIAILATGVLAWGAIRRRRDPAAGEPRLTRVLLVSLGLLAALCWWNLFQYSSKSYDHTYENYWDVYHYYIGSKYYPELEYTHLYECTVAADQEDGFAQLIRGRRVRNLKTNREVDAKYDPTECHHRFGPERWQSFKDDLRFFRTKLSPEIWAILLMDHGYNPTPAWGILGRAISSTASASDGQISTLMAIDVVLLIAMWVVVWRTFGWRVACVALVFWGTAFPMRSWWTAGAFLRNDWLFMSVAGICLLRRERGFLAGLALGYAALLRVFPVLLLVGILIKVVVDVARGGGVLPPGSRRRFLAGLVTAVVVLIPVSMIATGHVNSWFAFDRNSRTHLDSPVSNFMGAKTIVRHLSQPEATSEEAPAAPSEPRAIGTVARVVSVVFLLVALGLVGKASLREPDWVAAVLGAALIPFAVELTGYYYALFLVFAFLVVRRESVGIALCGLSIVFGLLAQGFSVPFDTPITYMWSSVAVLIFCGWLLALFAFGRGGGRSADESYEGRGAVIGGG
jgi:hypothetical protein